MSSDNNEFQISGDRYDGIHYAISEFCKRYGEFPTQLTVPVNQWISVELNGCYRGQIFSTYIRLDILPKHGDSALLKNKTNEMVIRFK